MRPGFVIMQIGNVEMDAIYDEVIAPAMRECDVNPIRVDKHNDGRLLQSQIARFIREAEIIIADLTNERPNCYAEVGLAMGWDKFGHVILTARDDHKPDRVGRAAGEPKVHFDFGGYDFLYWSPKDRSAYRAELVRRIRRRLGQLPASDKRPQLPWSDDWLAGHRSEAHALRNSNGGRASYMEVVFAPAHKLALSQKKVRDSAEAAQVRTFGWPLFLVYTTGDWRPVPSSEGIIAKVPADSMTDYWTLTTEGSGYGMTTNFEESRWDGVVAVDTRIVRVTEAFLYVRNLMKEYGVPDSESVVIGIWHGGLKGRALRFASPHRLGPHFPYRASVDTSGQLLEVRLNAIDGNLIEYVKAVVAPLLTLFDYFELSDDIYKKIVEDFVAGKTG